MIYSFVRFIGTSIIKAKASPANDCLAYEKPHKAIGVFIPLE
jgi:hypothetical protein